MTKGYPKLANVMGPYPDIAIFRRFGSLTMLNIMRLQAELVQIEDDLRLLQDEDNASKDAVVSSYSTKFCKLNDSKAPDNEQLKLLDKSRERLEQYHGLLIQAAEVMRLGQPSKQNSSFLRSWLIGESEGNNFQRGLEVLRTWDVDMNRDLIGLASNRSDQGDLSNWFKPAVVSAYHWLWQDLRSPIDGESGLVFAYDNSKFMRYSKWMVTLTVTTIASLLPALVILWLDHVNSTSTRIWITVGFTGGIGLLLKVVTNASTKEIFAATVAFAAVEVVFIGSADIKN